MRGEDGRTAPLRVGSLFAGIGGFDLAARWMGWETRWFGEVDPYCNAVLAKHWPSVPNHGDITKVDWANVEPVDLICGGFPCQDISNAGKRAGIQGERSGLWSEYARAIRELRPRYVVVENVAALLGRGLERVLGDLAASGYDAEWEVLSAADVGAPHRRERVWIVGYPVGAGLEGHAGHGAGGVRYEREVPQSHRPTRAPGVRGGTWDVAHAVGVRQLQPKGSLADIGGRTRDGGPPSRDVADAHESGRHGRAGELGERWWREPSDRRWWDTEPALGRVVNGLPRRVDRLRGLGNAIVPQCAFHIFQAIEAAEARVRAAA